MRGLFSEGTEQLEGSLSGGTVENYTLEGLHWETPIVDGRTIFEGTVVIMRELETYTYIPNLTQYSPPTILSPPLYNLSYYTNRTAPV